MIRQVLTATSANVFVGVTAGAGATFQARDASGAMTTEVRHDWTPGTPCWLKLEPRSENIEPVSVDEDPNRELSDGTCQDGSVASGLAAVPGVGVVAASLGFFPSLTYTITILYDSRQLLHRPAWTVRLSLRV